MDRLPTRASSVYALFLTVMFAARANSGSVDTIVSAGENTTGGDDVLRLPFRAENEAVTIFCRRTRSTRKTKTTVRNMAAIDNCGKNARNRKYVVINKIAV